MSQGPTSSAQKQQSNTVPNSPIKVSRRQNDLKISDLAGTRGSKESVSNKKSNNQEQHSVKEVKFQSFDNRKISGKSSARGSANQKNKSSKRQKSQYLVINTRHESSPARKDQIAAISNQLIEKNEKGEFKRVKFESPRLRYNLNELFENPPSFNEPLIEFQAVTKGQILQIDSLEGPRKELTEREKMELNNFAINNQDLDAAESPSQWQRVQKLLCSSKYNLQQQLEHWQYEDLRAPSLPFMAYQKDDLKEKIQKAKDYKRSPTFKQSGGYFLDYSKLDSKAKKMEKGGGTKKGRSGQNRNSRVSPRQSYSKQANKKNQKQIQEEVSNEESSLNGHGNDTYRPRSNLDSNLKFPKYFKSHILKRKANHSALRMQKMLFALHVDPELAQKSQRGKTPDQKRQEDLRIKLHMDKKLERFIERNVLSTSRKQENSIQCDVNGGTSMSNPATFRTNDHNFGGMSTLQTERGQICMTGSINGAFYCQKHPQQLVSNNYVQLLKNHESQQQKKNQAIFKVKNGAPKETQRSKIQQVTNVEQKYSKRNQSKISRFSHQESVSSKQKSILQKNSKISNAAAVQKSKTNEVGQLDKVEDSLYSEGPATFRNNSVGQYMSARKSSDEQEQSSNIHHNNTRRTEQDVVILPNASPTAEVAQNLNQDVKGIFAPDFEKDSQLGNKEEKKVKNDSEVAQKADKVQASVDDEEKIYLFVQEDVKQDQVKTQIELNLKESEKDLNERAGDINDHVNIPSMNTNDYHTPMLSTPVIIQRRAPSKDQINPNVDMQVLQTTATPISPQNQSESVNQSNTDSQKENQQQQVLFAGKNPLGEFSQTIDLLKRESQKESGKNVSTLSEISKLNAKVLPLDVNRFLASSNSRIKNLIIEKPQSKQAAKNKQNLLSAGTSTNDANSYIHFQDGDFFSNRRLSSNKMNVTALSGYEKMINNINSTYKAGSNNRPTTQEMNPTGRRRKQQAAFDRQTTANLTPISPQFKMRHEQVKRFQTGENFAIKQNQDNRVTTAPQVNGNRAFSLQKIRGNLRTRAKIQRIEKNDQFSTIYVGSGIPIIDASTGELQSRNMDLKKQYLSQTIEDDRNSYNQIQKQMPQFNLISAQSKDNYEQESLYNVTEVSKQNGNLMKNYETGSKLPKLNDITIKKLQIDKPVIIKVGQNAGQDESPMIASPLHQISNIRPKTVMNEIGFKSNNMTIRSNNTSVLKKYRNQKSPQRKETMSNFVKLFVQSKQISDAEKASNQFERFNMTGAGSMLSDKQWCSQQGIMSDRNQAGQRTRMTSLYGTQKFQIQRKPTQNEKTLN